MIVSIQLKNILFWILVFPFMTLQMVSCVGTPGAFIQVLTQEIKASVIKFGVRHEVDIPY